VGLAIAVLLYLLAAASPATASTATTEPPTVTISGTVTGDDTGSPAIANAQVSLIDDGQETSIASTVTSPAGGYELTGIPLDGRSFVLSITPPTGSPYLRREVQPIVPDPTGPNVIDVTLALGVRITGTVGLTNGESPAGATVTVSRNGSVAARRTVGADGAFDMAGLAAGTYLVNGALLGNGNDQVTVKDARLGQTYPVTLRLLSPGVVSGTVTSSDSGEPLEGITVVRFDESASTDSAGRYAITGATIGSYPVTFTDPKGEFVEFTTAPVTVATAQTVGAVDAALVPAAVITGTTRTPDGAPLGGVRVTSPQFDTDLSGISDFEGHYRIGGVPAGTYTLVGTPVEQPATSSSLETTGPTITVTSGEQRGAVDFALDSFGPVEGTLTRADPVEGDITQFNVTYVALDENFPEDGTAFRRTAHPDATGHYEIGLPPGRYLIRISPPYDGSTGEYDTSYEVSWWEHIHTDFDYEYPYSSLGSGTKIFVVERNRPGRLDLTIDRGDSFTSNPRPTITGTATVGQPLTATVESWKPGPVTYRYEWRRDSIAIPGATALTYTPTEADAGAQLTLAVTGSSAAHGIATAVSTPVVPVRALDPTPVPTIQGTPAVGSTLTADTGVWGPAPVTLTYQWKRNGGRIDGATGSTYLVTDDDIGKKISVVVTGSKAGYPSVSKTAASVTIAVPPPVAERIAGTDRYEGSTLISQQVAPEGSRLVYVASGENFPDSLSGSAIAAQRHAPLLLAGRASVPDVVAAEIARLEPDDIVVLGGENTLSPAVLSQLRALVPSATVTRIGGADRYEMSRNLILHPQFGAVASSRLFIATGRSFPDALSATPAAASVGAPVLLVDGQRTSFSQAERSLLTSRGITAVTTFGGSASLDTALGDQLTRLGIAVTRITGADRYAVSEKTAKTYFPAKKPRDVVYVAAGGNFPDALTGGVLAGSSPATPILLAQKDCLDQGETTHIVDLKAKRVVILGGPNSVAFSEFPFPACAP
jgi:putative cell wall-binding protein